VRGDCATVAEAFEQAALALTSLITDLDLIRPRRRIAIACETRRRPQEPAPNCRGDRARRSGPSRGVPEAAGLHLGISGGRAVLTAVNAASSAAGELNLAAKAGGGMSVLVQELSTACARAVRDVLRRADADAAPFPHWTLDGFLPAQVVAQLANVPIPPPTAAAHGARETLNPVRRYFDARTLEMYPVCRAVAEAFQSADVVRAIEACTGAQLCGSWLRIEYAQDIDGFWLEPHTDLGVKRFTLLGYLSPDDAHEQGTDLYWEPGRWAKRASFRPGAAIAFVPSGDSWHGFEPRPLAGVRKSLIVNYVSDEWRAREQLAFPDRPVS
jgi:hypothetical protein